jgi:hypothetical protein
MYADHEEVKNMTTYSWQAIREQAARTIGYPDAPTEQAVIDAFERNAFAVSRAVEKIVSRVHASKLGASAGWMIITREVEAITRPAPDVVATDTHERERALNRARQWMRNAGLYFPTEEEVLAEVFERSSLRDHDDEVTRAEILRAYREVRPIGERLEREELERAGRLKLQRAGRTRQAEAA